MSRISIKYNQIFKVTCLTAEKLSELIVS